MDHQVLEWIGYGSAAMLAASVVAGGERRGPPLWALVLRIVAGLGLIVSALPVESWTLAVVGGLTTFGGVLHYLAISRSGPAVASAAEVGADGETPDERVQPVRKKPSRTLAGRLKSRLTSMSGFSRWG